MPWNSFTPKAQNPNKSAPNNGMNKQRTDLIWLLLWSLNRGSGSAIGCH